MNYFYLYRSIVQIPSKLGLITILCITLFFSQATQAQVEENADSSLVVGEPDEEEPVIEQEKTALPEPLIYRNVPDSIAQKIQRQKDFDYANDSSYWTPEPQIQEQKGFWDYFYNFFERGTIRKITYGVLIVFFLFIIYRIIVVNKLFLFYSSKKATKIHESGAIHINDEKLDEKIQKAIDEKNHRMAVRYMYLKALQQLNERQLIHFHAETTNYEYVNQLSGHRLAGDFSFLTRVYDYVWYGEFILTPEQFDIVYKNFSHFYNAINS